MRRAPAKVSVSKSQAGHKKVVTVRVSNRHKTITHKASLRTG